MWLDKVAESSILLKMTEFLELNKKLIEAYNICFVYSKELKFVFPPPTSVDDWVYVTLTNKNTH